MVLNNSQELSSFISSFLTEKEDGSIEVKDKKKLRDEAIDSLAYTAALADDSSLQHEARVLIRKIASAVGINSASIYELYKAIGKGEVKGFSVPAMNIRMISYDFAQIIFEEAEKIEAGAFIFEIARSEIGYTDQKPDEFSASILAGAIKSGWKGPVFIQGDHYQFKDKIFKKNPQEEIDSIELLIKDSLMAQFYNIDIDASTLVDLDKKELSEQQKDNFEMTARLTEHINQLEPIGVTVSVGGEIGHIGGVNSNAADLEAFMEGYLDLIGKDKVGLTKVSVQTGSSHGGIPDENGKVIEVDIDFSVLKSISKVAREKYKLAGPVQHGASTLPEKLFSHFVENDTVEVHLATEFQNIIIDNLPDELRKKINEWTMENCGDEREEKWNDKQFIYKLRKKAVGPFKHECWMIEDAQKNKIKKALAKKIAFLFDQLNIAGTRHTVSKYVA